MTQTTMSIGSSNEEGILCPIREQAGTSAGSRCLVQVMLESMTVVTDVQLMCTVHACVRQWLQKKHTSEQLNHHRAQVQHSLLLTPSQAFVQVHTFL